MGKIFSKKRWRQTNKSGSKKSDYEEYTEGQEEQVFEYEFQDVGILHEGVSYSITGSILLDCERITIDFINKVNNDIPLRINILMPQNYILRNSRKKQNWGKSEGASPYPFTIRRGRDFSIEILITEECYMISANGHHYAEYEHRLPFRSINFIEVKGDVEKVKMMRRLVKSYPTRNEKYKKLRIETSLNEVLYHQSTEEGVDIQNIPSDFRSIKQLGTKRSTYHGLNTVFCLPYYGRLEPNLNLGYCIKIEGRVRVLPHSFSINLQHGHHYWPHPNIAFRFNPRYLVKDGKGNLQQVLNCSSYFDGYKQQDVHVDMMDEFLPGQTFTMVIVCGKRCFEVYVNRKWLMDFKHRVHPDIVDMLYIEGDIKIWDIALDNREWKEKKKKFYKITHYVEHPI